MSGLIAGGAAVWRRSPSGDIEVALVHRPRYDDWSLPKGKQHSGEALPVTAVREVTEETGYTVTLGSQLGSTRYQVPLGEKVVHYWTACPTGGGFQPSEEVDELRWLPFPDAIEMLSHQHDRTLLAGLGSAMAVTSTVRLVRHAKAGERKNWHGEGRLRPLTTPGRQQAENLRTLLPLWEAARVHSAPLVRCCQTVEGLAADLGVPIIEETSLTDEGYLAEPSASLARLIEIAAEPGGPAVVCSQGGVIPELIRTLAGNAGLALSRVPCEKGSFWGLFFGDDPSGQPVLLAADYYDDAVS